MVGLPPRVILDEGGPFWGTTDGGRARAGDGSPLGEACWSPPDEGALLCLEALRPDGASSDWWKGWPLEDLYRLIQGDGVSQELPPMNAIAEKPPPIPNAYSDGSVDAPTRPERARMSFGAIAIGKCMHDIHPAFLPFVFHRQSGDQFQMWAPGSAVHPSSTRAEACGLLTLLFHQGTVKHWH